MSADAQPVCTPLAVARGEIGGQAAAPEDGHALPPRSDSALPTRTARLTCLTPFDLLYSPLVAGWVHDPLELTWLAPGTPYPLTARKVADWARDRANRYLYWTGGDDAPAAYGELNYMPGSRDQMWIGHMVVDPRRRGMSVGRAALVSLLRQAFSHFKVSDVLLVVFPENRSAIRCYAAAGMIELGHEEKEFPATGRKHRFLRMGIGCTAFEKTLKDGSACPAPLLSDISHVW